MNRRNSKGTWAIIAAVAALSVVLAVVFYRPNQNEPDIVAQH